MNETTPDGANAQRGLLHDEHAAARDELEAARLLRLAADQGDAHAQYQLGVSHDKGEGVPHDECEAARFYRLAAEQGFAQAQCALGVCNDHGAGVPLNKREAARLFRLAANQGLARAQCKLGVCYDVGKGGVPKDEHKAARLYRLAADQGDADAQCNLGLYYEVGICVSKDGREAARLYRLAAEQGDVNAQLSLGRLLIKGFGGPVPTSQLREGTLLLAQAGEQKIKEAGFPALREPAHQRDIVHACCIGCGKSTQLKVCGRCRAAAFCGAKCAQRMWPVHRHCCEPWAKATAAKGQ